MSGMGWAFWGYGVVLLALGVYLWTLAVRTAAVRRRLDDLE